MTAHAIKHTYRTCNQGRHGNAEAGEEDERYADVFPFTCRTSPLCSLLCAVLVHVGDRGPAAALEAVGMCFVAVAVAGAEVRGVFARRLRGEALWDDGRQGEVV